METAPRDGSIFLAKVRVFEDTLEFTEEILVRYDPCGSFPFKSAYKDVWRDAKAFIGWSPAGPTTPERLFDFASLEASRSVQRSRS